MDRVNLTRIRLGLRQSAATGRWQRVALPIEKQNTKQVEMTQEQNKAKTRTSNAEEKGELKIVGTMEEVATGENPNPILFLPYKDEDQKERESLLEDTSFWSSVWKKTLQCCSMR